MGVRLLEREALCATAESCTGGLVAGAITDIAGSSGWFERGFVTYSNEAKMEMLGVPEATLARARRGVGGDGARDGRRRAGAQPGDHRGRRHRGGGPGRRVTPEKPVGMVCFAWATIRAATVAATHHFPGDRRPFARRRWWSRWRGAGR